MRSALPRTLLLSTLLLTGSALARSSDPAGPWQGSIELPSGELAIAVVLTAEGEGWSGTIDIPAQGVAGYGLSDVAVVDGRVRFAMAGIPGTPTFDGELTESRDAIHGTFRQGPQELRFSLRRPDGGEAGGGTGEAGTGGERPVPPAEPAAAAAPGVPGEGPVGDWMGALDVGPIALRVVVHVESAADGTLRAVLDSVDQDTRLPVDSLVVDGRAWRLTIDRIGASFTGTTNDDGSAVDGTWTQGGSSLPLRLARLAEPFVLARPQLPQPPFPYESRDVVFPNPRAGIRLAGTLIVPPGEGPFPAVLFVTGSGPQDRDESLLGHKPFLVIADALARRGVASLRYDDRGTAASEGDHMGSTVADFASDAEAGLAFLAAQPKIDRDALGILGHSEGGLAAPRVAATNGEVDFLVLLAPPGEPLAELVQRQAGDIFRQQGIDEALIEGALAAQAADLAMLADPTLDDGEVAERLRRVSRSRMEALTASQRTSLGLDEAAIERRILVSATPWFRSLLREDPARYLASIEIPVLALFAEKDLQVAAEVNGELVERALAKAGNDDYEVRVLPGLNHLFQHSTTGAIDEYGAIEETFAPEALEIIGDWIAARSARPEVPAAAPPGG